MPVHHRGSRVSTTATGSPLAAKKRRFARPSSMRVGATRVRLEKRQVCRFRARKSQKSLKATVKQQLTEEKWIDGSEGWKAKTQPSSTTKTPESPNNHQEKPKIFSFHLLNKLSRVNLTNRTSALILSQEPRSRHRQPNSSSRCSCETLARDLLASWDRSKLVTWTPEPGWKKGAVRLLCAEAHLQFHRAKDRHTGSTSRPGAALYKR